MYVTNPQNSDVLLGRGGKHFMNTGNKRLRKKAEEMGLSYIEGCKKERGTMIDCITMDLLQHGVRFLQCFRPIGAPEYWKEANWKKSREKVSQELREAVKKRKRGEVASVASSNTQSLDDSDNELSSSFSENVRGQLRHANDAQVLSGSTENRKGGSRKRDHEQEFPSSFSENVTTQLRHANGAQVLSVNTKRQRLSVPCIRDFHGTTKPSSVIRSSSENNVSKDTENGEIGQIFDDWSTS
jgi:hypothetical protein